MSPRTGQPGHEPQPQKPLQSARHMRDGLIAPVTLLWSLPSICVEIVPCVCAAAAARHRCASELSGRRPVPSSSRSRDHRVRNTSVGDSGSAMNFGASRSPSRRFTFALTSRQRSPGARHQSKRGTTRRLRRLTTSGPCPAIDVSAEASERLLALPAPLLRPHS